MTLASPRTPFSRRETQIVDILHTLGSATAHDVQQRLPDSPGYSTVRKLLEILEAKKVVRHTLDGRRFVYSPVTSRNVAGRSAMRHLLNTFFSGSVEQAAVALFTLERKDVDQKMLQRIERESSRVKRSGK